MTTAAAAIMIRPGPFTCVPKGFLKRLSRAARAALEDCLWEAAGRAEGVADLTDREIAAAIGCSIRTAQRAVHDLCNVAVRCVDGVVRPLMERWWQHGPKRDCGRRMAILTPEVIPVERAPDGAAEAEAERIKASFAAEVHRRPARPRGDAGPIPNLQPNPPPRPAETATERDALARQAAAFPRWRQAGCPGPDFLAWFAAHPEAGLSAVEAKPRE